MSFKCETCKETAPPGTPQHKVVTRTRQRVYYNRGGGDAIGSEIVREINVCDPCYKQARDQEN